MCDLGGDFFRCELKALADRGRHLVSEVVDLRCVIARRHHGLGLKLSRIGLLGVPFDRIAILLRNVEQYQPLVEEALRRAAIPAYFSRGVARPDPAGRAFLALLACAGEGCSASRFAEYLSLGQLPPVDKSGAPVKVAEAA